ncbi:MAG: hypothetical protein MJB14_11145 [Spirochaetes bacterium]|nr:hypothetical protein [Spirochaetota bacterium]
MLASICERLFLLNDFNNLDGSPWLIQLIDQVKRGIKLTAEDPELHYYLAFAYHNLITTVNTFFQYKDLRDKHARKLLKLDKEGLYSLLFHADYHMTYDKRAGADRKKGRELFDLLIQQFSDDFRALFVIAEIYYKRLDFEQSEVFYQKLLKKVPQHSIAFRRLKTLKIIKQKPQISRIYFYEKSGIDHQIFKRFLKVNPGSFLTPAVIQSIRKDLMKYRKVQYVSVDIFENSDQTVDLKINITAEKQKMVVLNSGLELVFNSGDIVTLDRLKTGIVPPVFYYSNSDFFNQGILDFTFYSVSGLLWNGQLKINILEMVDIRTEVEFWDLPVLFTLDIYSAKRKNLAKVNHLYLKPKLEIAKYFNPIHLDLSFSYQPKIYFLLPNMPDYEIQNQAAFHDFPTIIAVHNLRLALVLDLINLLEFGWVRSGFKIALAAEWLKLTPDQTWGYVDHPSIPTNTCFRFNVYGEYSKFFPPVFYISIAVQYQGGINMYPLVKPKIGKGTIGTPFGFEIKVHGLQRDQYTADHLFLINTLLGFKTSRFFHLGLYLDGIYFIEKYAISYLAMINDTDFSHNILLGFGIFFKWTPGWLFDIVFETSFALDTGGTAILGPVLGIYLQKTFLLK